MAADPPARPQEQRGYIRGGGGIGVDGRRLLRVVAVLAVCGMAALSIGLAVGAARDNSRRALQAHRGVPVPVTVTRCLGIGSGVGMSIEYWQCHGSYSLAGRSYEAVIGGNRSLLEHGQVVQAVAVPGRPDLLSVRRPPGPQGWTAYLAAIAVGAAAVLGAVALVWAWSSRRRRGA
ncbi:MAG TPA: hypothetical protein VFN68_05845 [Acidimicrobiales bacterium]|nr:hypothetical protein [Acidimicrobiales bacterium]